ncbi:phasin family protein [Phreatobacter sp.]|uniref:phasin family protein n=1 Tax=Phreatobacter sp. TaxID=1966341 RepID=UPI003F6FE81C
MSSNEPAPYAIPIEMREFADRSVEQARRAFEGFVGAAQRTVEAMEQSSGAMQTGARETSLMAIGIAEANVAASLAFAQRMVRASDMMEMMQIQSEFLQSQMQVMQAQARDLGAAAVTAPPAPKPARKG